jgi:uncharacterized protein YfaS (alpha-2-macroglobulin family)
MSVKQRYYAGETVAKKFKFYDETDTLFNPDTISIAIVKPDGTTAATKTKADLTKISDGIYNLFYNLASDASVGTWKFVPTATKTTGNRIGIEVFTFIVEAT